MRKTKIRTLRFGEVRLWECRSPQVKFSGGDRQVPARGRESTTAYNTLKVPAEPPRSQSIGYVARFDN